MERGLLTQAVQRRLYCRTPLVESLLLHRSYVPEVPVFLKLENSQYTGSFKLRGLSRLCQHMTTGCWWSHRAAQPCPLSTVAWLPNSTARVASMLPPSDPSWPLCAAEVQPRSASLTSGRTLLNPTRGSPRISWDRTQRDLSINLCY